MKQEALYNNISEKLDEFEENSPLPGLASPAHRDAFIQQLRDSVRRVNYISVLKNRTLHPNFADPNNSLFDPIKAAILHQRDGNINEAFWLVFLFVHFGKHQNTGYKLTQAVYGKLGGINYWTWDNVINDIVGFRQWLGSKENVLRQAGTFGNHRKYQSIRDDARAGTGATIESYVDLIGNDHVLFFSLIDQDIRDNPFSMFEYLYRLFKRRIIGFSRLSVFDFTTMLGKIGLITAEPSSPYLQGSTGPKEGTKVLFDAYGVSTKDLDECLRKLGEHLDFRYSMQIVEDAVCNWQKSPNRYVQFRG